MTSTGTAPAPDADIPGVTRRHTFADLYHERTNYQFIKHSRRWFILSGTLIVLSLLALGVRGLNLGIEFEGGTSWQVPASGDISVSGARDAIEPLGFGDAKVTTLSGSEGTSIRVQAEVIDDPVLTIQDALATAGGISEADVQVNTAGAGGAFEMTASEKVDQAKIEQALRDVNFPVDEVTVDGNAVTVRYDTVPPSPVDQVAAALAKDAGAERNEVSVSTVGPTWGDQVSRKAIQALVVFFILLALYLAFRFEWKMAASSIIVVTHDIIITIGFYVLLQFEVTPATVTVFLTILGFSLYDTVVVFDKIRENERPMLAVGKSTYSEVVNKSLNETLMRSLSTTLVAVLPVASLLVVGAIIMGATTLENFALALLVGLIVGAYSSIFVAAPILAWWKERDPRYRAIANRINRSGGGSPVKTASQTAKVTSPAADAAGPASSDGLDDGSDDVPVIERDLTGVPGPPAVGRTDIPKPRQPRGKKRR